MSARKPAGSPLARTHFASAFVPLVDSREDRVFRARLWGKKAMNSSSRLAFSLSPAIAPLLLFFGSAVLAGEPTPSEPPDKARRHANAAEAKCLLGAVHAENGEWEKVLDVLYGFELEFPDLPDHVIRAAFLKARACVQLGKDDRLEYCVRLIQQADEGMRGGRRRVEQHPLCTEAFAMAASYFREKSAKALANGENDAAAFFKAKARWFTFAPFLHFTGHESREELAERAARILDIAETRLSAGDFQEALEMLELIHPGDLGDAKRVLAVAKEWEAAGDRAHARGMVATARAFWQESLGWFGAVRVQDTPEKAAWWSGKCVIWRILMKLGHYKEVALQIENAALIAPKGILGGQAREILEEARWMLAPDREKRK
jgi:hypothetical protein